MLSGKKVSLKNVIAKVYADLNIKDESYLTNIIEWLGEALGKIKADQQLESSDPLELCIHNHKAELPCDLIYLENVDYCGKQLAQASGQLFENSCNEIGIYNQYFSVDLRKFANKPFHLGQQPLKNPSGEFFKIENGWFKTTFPEGNVTIRYKKLATDDEGFPLVPEEESFRSALFWYVAWKYFYLKKIDGSNADFNRYHTMSLEAEQKWHWYCGQAGSEALMPDQYTLENIKRNFISLVPKIESFTKSFSDLNK